MKVIDISGWQEGIDWDKVVEAGVEGVIVKISEGTNIEDTWWSHVYEAKRHNLKWGVYCFSHASTPDEAKAEANEVLYLLGGETTDLGIWFDFESNQNLNADDPTGVCSAFIVHCNESGLSAGVYASLSTFEDVLNINLLADYVPYWCAQYSSRCNFKDSFPDKHLAGWQYSDSYKIGGMDVDVNEWYD